MYFEVVRAILYLSYLDLFLARTIKGDVLCLPSSGRVVQRWSWSVSGALVESTTQ